MALAAPSHSNVLRRTAQPLPRPNLIPQHQGFLSYNWTDRDPELDFVVACIGNAGRSPEWIEEQTEKEGHKVSRNTIYNWCYGHVKRPQNASMSMVMGVLGYNKHWSLG